MRDQEFLLYRVREGAGLLRDMARIIRHYEQGRGKRKDGPLFYSAIHRLLELAGQKGFYGNLWHCYLADLLVRHENSYSIGCEIGGEVKGSVELAALHDLEIFREFFRYDFTGLTRALEVREFDLATAYDGGEADGRPASRVYSDGIRRQICALARSLGEAGSAADMKESLTAFYQAYGVGKFGLHKAFRVACPGGSPDAGAVRIVPISKIARVRLDDLVGYEAAKKKLTDNTEAFVEGRKANNCLLYGDAGTGKSSCMKAVANAYYGKGLRVIEIYKHQFRDLQALVGQIKNRRYKFILFMDDLSFEEFETDYKYLKAVIEGGLERRPDNVLIYATSNRRHLIRENYGDKIEGASSVGSGAARFSEVRQDMHAGDTVQEKLSLAARFGVTIYFGAPDKKEFQHIVWELALRNGLDLPREQLLLAADRWELFCGARSGRCAQQFIDDLLGKQRGTLCP
ncbi:MAG: ATP-binding protein [Clostridium sp.]|jgi:predicted AAA+ superfamily ATPase|nr:ATP-binding protein [Clostridium sp.]